MAKDPKRDWYWPLGALDYEHEIRDFFPEEAEMLGVITILWNRHEKALGWLFLDILKTRRRAFAEAIWSRQSTHQGKRDLLALALHTVKLTKRQASALRWVIDNTKTVADRRNELIHAEYVVHGRTDKLHAKVRAPRSNKPPKHQKVTTADLQKIIVDLSRLVQGTEQARWEFATPSVKRLGTEIAQRAKPRQRSPQSL